MTVLVLIFQSLSIVVLAVGLYLVSYMIKDHPVFKISNKIMILIFIPMIVSESCCVILDSTYIRMDHVNPLNLNTTDSFYLAMNLCDFVTLFFFAYLMVKVTESDEFLHISMLLLRKDVKFYVINRESDV